MDKLYALGWEEIHNAQRLKVGNKAFNLACMKKNIPNINVPKAMTLFHDCNLTDEIIETVAGNFSVPFILRSSTSVEDSDASFAGQFESAICKNITDFRDCYAVIKNSACSEQVEQYCKAIGFDFDKINTSVLIQEYLDAEMSGVLFTKNPVTNDESVVYIEYSEHTSDAVTAGSKIPSALTINKGEYAQSEFPFSSLCEIALKAESTFGFSLDIEWIVSDQKLWIVQVRKITT